MTIKTTTHKDFYGWKSESSLPLGDKLELRVTTRKMSSGALVTSAQRYRVENGMISFMMFSDFSKTYKSTKTRCTEKSVNTQHREVMMVIDQIKSDCENFYKQK